MFGFLLGTACLLGLVWVLRGGRRHGRCWSAERDFLPGGGDRRHFGRGMFLRWLFERLDTTPGQERVIRDAVDDFIDRAWRAKSDVEQSRGDVARAVGRDALDEAALGEVFAKHDGALSDVRQAFVGALAKIHEVLDERQRTRLAELIEAGVGRRWHGPYRSAF